MFQSQANNLGLVKFQLPHLSFRALGGFFPPCAGGAPAVKRFHSIGTLLLSVTALMTLDVWIFGRVRTGPFFVLLERTTTGTPSAQAER